MYADRASVVRVCLGPKAKYHFKMAKDETKRFNFYPNLLINSF